MQLKINSETWFGLTGGLDLETKGRIIEATFIELDQKKPLTLKQIVRIGHDVLHFFTKMEDTYTSPLISYPKKSLPTKKEGLPYLQVHIGMLPFSEEFRSIWNEWLEYKYKEKGFRFKTEKSMQTSFDALVKISHSNPESARKIINYSIANGYSGLFPGKREISKVYKEKNEEFNWK